MQGKTTAIPERVGRVGQRRQLVIPRDMLESLKVQEGDFVAFSRHANGVLIKPKRLVDPDDVLTPAETKKVLHALKQVRQGKTKTLAQIKHELDL
jgi:bifunctional DNA-binding transcriptional regulator/antitoxin component of YhaV-PrlF toxin-antitoxin module